MPKPTDQQTTATAVVPPASAAVDQIGQRVTRDETPRPSAPTPGKCGCGGPCGGAENTVRSPSFGATPLPLRSAATHAELARTGLRPMLLREVRPGVDARPLPRACEEHAQPLGEAIHRDLWRADSAASIAPTISSPGRPKTLPKDGWPADPKVASEWQSISRVVYLTRLVHQPAKSNDLLAHEARSRVGSPMAPLYDLWVVDNLLLGGDFEAAFGATLDWTARWSDSHIDGRPLIATVLHRRAECAEQLGDFEAAERALQDTISVQSKCGYPHAGPWFKWGELCERQGDISKAIWAFQQASLQPGEDGLPAAAQRRANRLRRETPWVRPDLGQLAAQLLECLRTRDLPRLEDLASRSQFAVGQAGGHLLFTEPDRVLPTLFRDLARSRVTGDPEQVDGSGSKRYLRTAGWLGGAFADRVELLLCKVRGGWEWAGVIVQTPRPCTLALMEAIAGPPTEPLTNQPLTIPIKAPWPSPFSFQAGGVGTYLSTSFLFGPSFAAIVGGRPCGLGPGGFYYNNWPSHWEQDQYAIDFSRWERGHPWPANYSKRTPLLACADGRVDRFYDVANAGTTDRPNFVDLQLRIPGTNPPVRSTLTARYFHLDGPRRMYVSRGMWMDEGAVLGVIDDTGTSVHDHLHFEIRDSSLPLPPALAAALGADEAALGRSVRINPLDGQRLDDGDDGRCITSTNRILDPATLCERFATGRWADAGTEFHPDYYEIIRRHCYIPREPTPSERGPVCASRPGGPRLARCADRCVDLASDPSNCGRCGLNCGVDDAGARLRCVSGTCEPS